MSEKSILDFSGVYDAYYKKVVAWVTKLIGRDDAEDLANEVFAKVARSLGTADPARLASWIYTIMLNTVRDATKSRASRLVAGAPRAQDEGDALAEVADPRIRTPEETAVRNEMVACYLEYVKQLPRDYYQVYVMSEFEQLSNPEIARRLSVSLATVKIRLHRARTRLHDELRRHCQCYYNERGELMGEPKS